jgi:acyl carrier protein
MSQSAISDSIRTYIANEILDGKDIGLDNSTPLLEWGVLNSMEIARLVNFLQNQFRIEVPDDKIVLDNFKDVDSITSLVSNLDRK